ncbi:MAG: exodeoxyribonuclease VII small subunit [Planctomycetales bacterium]
MSDPFEFESAVSRLERIVDQLEGGDVDLGDALEQFEEGCGLLKQCREFLETAERRVDLLTGTDEQGEPVLQPFDENEDEPLPLEDKAAARSSRRSSNSPRARKKSSRGSSRAKPSDREPPF